MHALQRKYEEQIQGLADTAVKTADLGYVASHGGNLSWRVSEDEILITPTKVCKGDIAFDDVTIVDTEGNTLFASEGRKPTGETPLHVRLLNRRPDLQSLVHAHPPALTGLALARSTILEQPLLPEPVTEIGPVASIPYVEPVSEDLAVAFDDASDVANAFLMFNHGVMIGCVDGADRALSLLQMLEATAISVATAVQVGEVVALTDNDVRRLDAVREARGIALPGAPGVHSDLVGAYASLRRTTPRLAVV